MREIPDVVDEDVRKKGVCGKFRVPTIEQDPKLVSHHLPELTLNNMLTIACIYILLAVTVYTFSRNATT